MNTVPWKLIKNTAPNKPLFRGRARRDVAEKYEEKFGIRFLPGNGYSIINDDLAHFEPQKYKGRARYDWPKHDRILVVCRDYNQYAHAMIASGLDPAPKGTVQSRRSIFRTAGFKVSSWRRW